MLKKYAFLLLTVGLSSFWGCMAFHYPPMEKQLVSMWIHSDQIDAMKSAILNEGYKRISKEDYFYKRGICTDYAKEISINNIKTNIQILFNFSDIDTPKNYYSSLGITILTLNHADIPEVKAEVDRVEKILYEKLLEVTDREYIKRGRKEIYAKQGDSVFKYRKRGKPVPKLAIWDRNAVKKKLNTSWIPRDKVSAIKSTILAEGYQRNSNGDVFYDDETFVTEYSKEIPTVKKKSNIQVKLAFKESYTPKDYYRDLSITILDFGKDAPEVNSEIERINGILYKKLIEAAGAEHVKEEGK